MAVNGRMFGGSCFERVIFLCPALRTQWPRGCVNRQVERTRQQPKVTIKNYNSGQEHEPSTFVQDGLIIRQIDLARSPCVKIDPMEANALLNQTNERDKTY